MRRKPFRAAAPAAPKPLRLGSGFEVEALASAPGRALWRAGTNAAAGPPHVFVGRLSSSGAHKAWDHKTPADLVRGPDGEVWLTVPSADEVAQIDANSRWHGIVGPEGSLPTGLVVRMTPAGSAGYVPLESGDEQN